MGSGLNQSFVGFYFLYYNFEIQRLSLLFFYLLDNLFSIGNTIKCKFFKIVRGKCRNVPILTESLCKIYERKKCYQEGNPSLKSELLSDKFHYDQRHGLHRMYKIMHEIISLYKITRAKRQYQLSVRNWNILLQQLACFGATPCQIDFVPFVKIGRLS